MNRSATPPLVIQPRFDGTVLFGGSERPLLVPKGNDEFVREAVRMFVPGRVRRCLATVVLKLDRWLPQLHMLRTVESMPPPLAEIYRELGFPAQHFAIYYGSPGPLRKLTIYASSVDRSVTKLALQPSADEMITNEGKILTLLAEHRIGVDYVPALLGHGQLSCGRRFVRTSVLPPGRRESRFGPKHRGFLAQLYAHGFSLTAWVGGTSYQSLLNQLAAIRCNLDGASLELLDAVVREIAVLSGNEPVNECIVHGDFAPWNMTVSDDRLRVFDWEYAAPRGNPLHDFLHFHLISDAPSRRALGAKRIVGDASRHLALVAGSRPPAPLVAALILHYLAQVVIFFCSADGTLKHGHPIIKSYLHLMRTRATWLLNASRDGGPTHER